MLSTSSSPKRARSSFHLSRKGWEDTPPNLKNYSGDEEMLKYTKITKKKSRNFQGQLGEGLEQLGLTGGAPWQGVGGGGFLRSNPTNSLIPWSYGMGEELPVGIFSGFLQRLARSLKVYKQRDRWKVNGNGNLIVAQIYLVGSPAWSAPSMQEAGVARTRRAEISAQYSPDASRNNKFWP